MCGIVGYWTEKQPTQPALVETLANQLRHRGPDDSGIWWDEATNLALGHRRLSVIDLSPAGSQPMISHSRRYVIVYNGEIYNHLELRAELERAYGRIAWRGHSDTETLLEAIEHWGLESTLRRLVGMFAFAVWDICSRQLTLARDRMGEKPLYYGYQEGVFMFASELKALAAHPAFRREINLQALARYFQYGYVPAPDAIYTGIHKLPPGAFLTLSEADLRRYALPTPRRYWSLQEIGETDESRALSDEEATRQLEALLRQAVRGQMVADVPLGAFLSGGIDSSTVVALMQAESSQPVRTFTIGFHEARYNEAVYAKAVANHLGTQHTELYLSPTEAAAVIPELPRIYDEPFADASQIPTYLVARLARASVTVCLSGDGGDELFAGYSRYPFTLGIVQRLQRWARLPRSLRRLIVLGLKHAPLAILNALAPRKYRQLVATGKLSNFHRERLCQLLELAPPNVPNVYRFLILEGVDPQKILSHVTEQARVDETLADKNDDAYRWMCTFDALTYLPDDILVKLDRAAMAVSLETRVPLLDHRVVEFAWQLPTRFKVRDGQGKWLLRRVLEQHVPRELIERPKSGFGVPLYEWLRGSLHEWAEELLSETQLRRSGLLRIEPIRACWREHLAGTHNWEDLLWKTLMFQAWLLQDTSVPSKQALPK